MIRSKVNKASSFAFLLFSYLDLTNLGHLGCTIVTALPHPSAQKEGNEAIPSTKLREISEWNRKSFRSAPKSEIDEKSFQVVESAKLQDKNEIDRTSYGIQKARDQTARREKKQDLFSFAKFVVQRFFNRLDAMDKMIFQNTLPLVGVTAIVPILQSIDLFWVNQLGDTISVSAQSAANTLYQFSFGLISFIPSVTATLVSKNFANNDIEKTESTLTTALLFGFTTSFIISMIIFANPGRYLGTVLKGKKGTNDGPMPFLCEQSTHSKLLNPSYAFADGNPALGLSVKYMRIRCLSLVPQMVTFVCFGAFRGMLGTSSVRNLNNQSATTKFLEKSIHADRYLLFAVLNFFNKFVVFRLQNVYKTRPNCKWYRYVDKATIDSYVSIWNFGVGYFLFALR